MRTKDDSKVETIFSASLKLIRKDGIAGITMAKIARESKMAIGTLYIYFKNKEDLINALYLELEKRSSNRFIEGYDPEKPFAVCLKKVWINYLKHRIEFYEESVFLEQYYRSPFISDSQKKIAESMKIPVYKLIERGKKELLIKADIDNEMLFSSMIGFIRELANEHMEGRYSLNKNRIEKAFKLNWDCIKA